MASNNSSLYRMMNVSIRLQGLISLRGFNEEAQ